ncbi:PHD finger protein ING2-like isoform X1 [Lolium rigidum]|uniref:PHD finger protein ING2-like isoform X1 n=1 Tax=Lolium rigidum TaxID=89674 RepID=UPI001F5E1D9F|nr:PHD finger protein ING2-like isoform X1 [Lolium rigidum]
MAIARTGVYVDDYLECEIAGFDFLFLSSRSMEPVDLLILLASFCSADSSTLAGDLQRILSTMHELDERADGILGQTKRQIKYLLRPNMVDDDDAASDRVKKDIENSQDNALSLCTEKVLLARQAYDLIESHVKRLDEDLGQFGEDLKQEGKIPPDEPHILPPMPMGGREEKRRHGFSTPQAKKFREREWERERGMDFDLMPPPGSSKKAAVSMDVEQMIDPNEPTYCICHQVSYGDMIACDNENCEGGEWFHYSCVGLTPETRFKGKWFCPTCRNLQ